MKQPSQQEQKSIDHFIKHGKQIDAYRAGFKTSNMTDKTAHRNATRLFARPHVKAAVDATKARPAQQFDLEVFQIKQMLAGAAAAGLKMKTDRMGNRVPVDLKGTVSALSEVNRMNGNHAAVKSEISGPDGGPVEVRTFADFYEDVAENGDA